MNLALVVILGLVAIALVRCILVDSPLGHDESVYAVAARGLLQGTPTTGWGLHRPVGMTILAAVGYLLDGSEWALRLLPSVLGLAFFFYLFRLGRIVAGPIPALGALATLATSQHLLRRCSELLSDAGSSVLVFALLHVAVIELENERGPTRRLILCAPLGAGAFYLRYGVSLGLVAAGISAILVWRGEVLRAWRIVAATLVTFLLLVTPFAIWSKLESGSILGILRLSGSAAGREYLGQGLSDYWQMLIHRSLGLPLTVAVVVGFGVGLWGLLRNKHSRSSRFLFLFAVLQVAFVGLVSHGEPRYVFLGIGILTIFGVQAVINALPSSYLRPACPIVVLGFLGFHLHASHIATRRVTRLAQARRVLVDSSQWIRDSARGSRCTVYTAYLPQITWYTSCESKTIDQLQGTLPTSRTQSTYLLLFDKGKRQPTRESIVAWGVSIESPVAVIDDVDGTIGSARVFELR